MELLPEGPSRLPIEVRKYMSGNWNSGMSETFRKIACIELGLFDRITEEDLMKEVNATPQQWAVIKKNHREDIEKYKESHKLGKLKIINSVSERVLHGEIYAKAIFSGDVELARKAKLVMETLNKFLPIDALQKAGEVMTELDDEPKSEEGGRASIQINVNSPASEAQKRLEEKKKKKAVDI